MRMYEMGFSPLRGVEAAGVEALGIEALGIGKFQIALAGRFRVTRSRPAAS